MKLKKIVQLLSVCIIYCSDVLYAPPAPTPNISIMSRLYGNYYSPAIAGQQIGQPGTIDTTFAEQGYANLTAQMEHGIAVRVQTLSNGDYLVVLQTTGVNSLIAKYNAQGVLQTSYGVDGLVDLGSSAIYPCAGMIDAQNRMIVGGGTVPGTAGWISRVDEFGSQITPFSIGSSWQYINCLGQQSTGKIIASGSNQSNAQLARFNLDGTIDTTFGTHGFISFDGTGQYPLVTSGFDFVIDQNNLIYATYVDANFNVFVLCMMQDGVINRNFGTNGIKGILYLSPATQGWESALDIHNNLIITAAADGVIKVTAISASTGGAASPAFADTVIASEDQLLTIGGIVTTQDPINSDQNSIIIIGTNRTYNMQQVTKLYGTGGLDIFFNGTGFIQFQAINGGTNSYLDSISLDPTGQIYVCGQEADGDGIIFPYVYKLYNDYVVENSSYPIAVSQQGVIDTTFGVSSENSNQKQIYSGIVNPYVGKYKGSLQQHAQSILQVNYGTYPAIGDFIIGMYGSTDTSNPDYPLSMMLNFLTTEGLFDDTVGTDGSGQLILDNESLANEFLWAMAQDDSGFLYVAGSASDHGATLRAYTTESTAVWTQGTSQWSVSDATSSTSQGVGVALHGQDIVLLFENLNSVQGRIIGYDRATGHLADGTDGVPTFGHVGSGFIDTLSYTGLSMGPVYGGVINDQGSIFVAYKSVANGLVDVAAFNADGSALVSSFADSGIAQNIFGLTLDTYLDGSSVRIAFDNAGNLIVAAVVDSNIVITKMNQITGVLNTIFGVNGIATIALSSPTINQLQGISDGRIVLTGSLENHAMYLIRLTSQGFLDTTFNSQGSLPGLAFISAESNPVQAQATSCAVQSATGNIVVAGFQDQYYTDASPTVAQFFGTPGTIAVRNYPDYVQDLGTRDVSFNNSGAFNLSELIADGTAQVLYVYPFESVYQGLMLIGISDDNYSYVARFNPVTLTLDQSFNERQTPGYYTTAAGQVGITCLTVDADERIIFAGYDESTSWAQRLSKDGSFEVAFDLSQVNQITAIDQQKSGRYICAGNILGVGYSVFAFQDELVDENTQLQLDATFNSLGNIPGTIVVTGAPMYSLVINNDDTILVSWTATWNDNILYAAKIVANGSGFLTTFGSDGIVNTGISVGGMPKTARMVCDIQDSIIVAASTSPEDIQVVRLLATDGSIDPSWNGGFVITINGFGHSVKLTDIITSATGQNILIGYNSIRRVNGINGPLFAVSLDASGALDTTWNPHPSGRDVPGILTYHVAGSTLMGQGGFAIDGNLFVVGGTGTQPLVMEIVAAGLPVLQAPLAGDAGVIDTTINTQGTEYDALNMNLLSDTTLGVPSQLHIINDSRGAMLMTSQLDTTSYLTKFNAALQFDTDFNASGTSPSAPGLVAFDATASINDLFVQDAQGDLGTIYVTGDTQDSTMWAAMIGVDGSWQTSLALENSLSTGRAICVGKDRILIAGQSSAEGTPGVIFASNFDMSKIDTSFGNGTPGYYSTGMHSPISAMVVDNQYRIYIAYKNMSRNRLVVQRISADGTGVDFTAENGPSSCNPQQIKIFLDQEHDQFVVANYHYTALYVSRYSMLDGSLQGSCQVRISSENLQLSDLFVDTDRNIYLVGFNVHDSYETIVARIRSVDQTTIELDPTYAADGATPGIANISVTPINQTGFVLGAGILHPDRRVYVVGATSENIPYMARLFGNMYAQQICQAVSSADPGDFDPTYGDGVGYTTTFAGTDPYDPTSAQQVKSIVHLEGTSLMTVIDNGIDSWTVKVLQDGTNDPAYGDPAGQGVLIVKLTSNESVSSMIVSSTGAYFVIGQNSQYGGYLKKIEPNGAMSTTFGGYTGVASTKLYPVGTAYGLMNSPADLVELTDGSIVIAGSNSGIGMLQKIGTTGIIVTNFSNLSSSISGLNIASIVADADNNLYCAIGYNFDEGYAVRVVKLSQDGTIVWQNDEVLFGANSPEGIQLALDGLGNIVVAATSGQQNGNLHVTRLLPAGVVDPDFNAGQVLNVQVSDSAQGFALANVADLVCLQDGRTLIAGYYQDLSMVENNAQFVVCVDRYGSLDSGFNYYEHQGSVQGVALFATGLDVQQSRVVFNMDVQTDGKILLAASQSPALDEQTPLTIRLIGFINDQAIAKYPGQTLDIPSVLDTSFDGTGVATTGLSIESLLIAGGAVVVDSLGRTIVSGLTESGSFILARFLVDGTFDTSFGVDGIASSAEISNLIAHCSVAIDPFDNLYVCSVVATLGTQGQFVVIKFDTTGSVVSSFGDGGVLTLSPGSNLVSGGYITYDILENYIVMAGYSSDGKFILYRFTSDGQRQINSVVSNLISGLSSGGFVAVNGDSTVYISGTTAIGLVVMKFIQVDGLLQIDFDFGVDGVVTLEIPDFVDGGAIALDVYNNIVLAGYTSNLQPFAARLTPSGNLDTTFNQTGIAYGRVVTNLQNIVSVAIGSLNDVIVGGHARSYSGIGSFVVSNFTTNGNPNVAFAPTGTAVIDVGDAIRTISNAGLVGGFLAINPQGQIFVGGVDYPTIATPGGSKLVVAKCYSGYETFVTDPKLLSGAHLKNYFYGNNIEYVNRVIALNLLAVQISDKTVRQVVIDAVQAMFDAYYLIYTDIPGFNLVLHLYLLEIDLQFLQNDFIKTYPIIADEINACFGSIIQRIIKLKIL
jgi:uncharacterized delta-60 repeat protein